MADKTLRPPPSYQEYASDLLANRHYMLMSLSEHGLFDVMRKQCWVNKSVPINKEDLAKIIGCKVSEVEANLSPHVLHFFIEKEGEYICPELENYRLNLEDRRRRISEGGKKGGETTQAKNKGRLKGSPKPLSRDGQSRDDLIGNEFESIESDVNENTLSEESSKWINDYDQTEPF